MGGYTGKSVREDGGHVMMCGYKMTNTCFKAVNCLGIVDWEQRVGVKQRWEESR